MFGSLEGFRWVERGLTGALALIRGDSFVFIARAVYSSVTMKHDPLMESPSTPSKPPYLIAVHRAVGGGTTHTVY